MSETTLKNLRQGLHQQADPARAAVLQRFFKTAPGEYGAGDRFLGLRVPQVRQWVREGDALAERELLSLLTSPWHEERLLALLIMVRRHARADAQTRARLHRLYLDHTAQVNNWDLVDSSAEYLVGAQLDGGPLELLQRLACSDSVWERRIAIMATFHFIKRGRFEPTLNLAEQLLTDPHPLLHKAVGWMLRETGKRSPGHLHDFLRQHAARMPRTMLRYAIEKLPPAQRKEWMAAR